MEKDDKTFLPSAAWVGSEEQATESANGSTTC